MDLPGVSPFSGGAKEISTSSLDELAQFQTGKNRRYIQLQPGKLQAHYMDVFLGRVQIFKETLNLGVRLEASPASCFVPFASVSPRSDEYRFCGQERVEHSIAQASGGHWDLSSKGGFDYIGCAFEKEYFHASYQALLRRSVPKQYLISMVSPTAALQSERFFTGLNYILRRSCTTPRMLEHDGVVRLLCSEVLKLALDALAPTSESKRPLKKLPKRIKGAKLVAEYIDTHAARLPDMATLCRAGNLSERSLQYGFMEYMGVTPIQYLRLVRLNGARSELMNTVDPKVKVSEVALNWGFIEFGRFSRDYRQLFHELPSQTLRR